MCLTCGCMLPHERHGNPDHLVIEDLEKSARLDKVNLDQAVDTLVKTVQVAKKEPGHQHG